MNSMPPLAQHPDPLAGLLKKVSVEVVSTDHASVAMAGKLFKPGTEVFIASLPKHKAEKQIDAAIALRKSALVPVPHIVARNIANQHELDALLRGLNRYAGVDTALVLGGDLDQPLGLYRDSLQLLDSGLFEHHGIRKIRIACYPEGHPRIGADKLHAVMAEKIATARASGLDVALVSQFCFDAKPILAWTRALRAAGVTVPYRVGVAGPASRAALLKFALLCGVGPSLRALQSRDGTARNMLSGETPEVLLRELAAAQAGSPSLNIEGVHFFTFGALATTSQWIEAFGEPASAA